MKLSQFKFKLPEERIALEPTFHRDDSKLMVVHKKTGEIEHRLFKEVLNYFDEGDTFLFNDSTIDINLITGLCLMVEIDGKLLDRMS